MGLSRDQFLTLPDLPSEDVDAPPWGRVTVKTLNALELLDLLEFLNLSGEGESDTRVTLEGMAKIAAHCLVDDEGNRLLQDDEYQMLYRKQGAKEALGVIVAAADRLNQIFVRKKADGEEKNE